MRIIVIDDEKTQRQLLAGFLQKQGYNVRQADSGKEALALIEKEGAELAITDMRMPEMDGLTLLNEIRNNYPDTAVIVITAYASVESAVKAMQSGAADYLIKPINLEQLSIIIQKIEKNQRLIAENLYLKRRLETVESFPDMLGRSESFLKVLADISLVARSDSTVLIRGESGTGKELAARAIHAGSNRKDGPFLAVNCAALPETLLESELFGYERGAFTGAAKRRIGRFELADGGTLFLDEIGDLPMPIQVKLLRVLESKTFERLGGNTSIKVDIRLIAATNRDLEERITAGLFREDLFYRLNVVPLFLPPLRQRKDDILFLAGHFIKRFSARSGRAISGLTPKAKDMLMRYPWPGNIRELENTIERAVVLCRGDVIDVDSLGGIVAEAIQGSAESQSLNLAEIEKETIIKAIKKADGKLAQAATLLGIHRNTLRLKIRQYKIETP